MHLLVQKAIIYYWFVSSRLCGCNLINWQCWPHKQTTPQLSSHFDSNVGKSWLVLGSTLHPFFSNTEPATSKKVRQARIKTPIKTSVMSNIQNNSNTGTKQYVNAQHSISNLSYLHHSAVITAQELQRSKRHSVTNVQQCGSTVATLASIWWWLSGIWLMH